jgi:hypothetical protein
MDFDEIEIQFDETIIIGYKKDGVLLILQEVRKQLSKGDKLILSNLDQIMTIDKIAESKG